MPNVSLRPGQKAPDFTLLNQDAEPVSLNAYRGRWVVLYFYPKDNTPGCTIEAEAFSRAAAEFDALNAVVVGVSADTPQSHCRFIEKRKLRVTLLSDPDHAALNAYGAWGPKPGRLTEGITRSTVLIDPEGVIAHHWPEVKAAGHAEEVRQTLARLQKRPG